ncbi:MAG TPA: NADPH-dependent oxidoreductase [Candidatus Pacearchaeota archaeon]|nr:NADPH-dependent oxidoreductase [Candidatus Pacearchaeota archaeon]
MVLKAAVILGSVREGRQGIKAARFIENALKARKWDVIMVDPIEYKLPLLEKRYQDYEKGKAPKALEKLAKIFKEADAFVIITAEYNHLAPPALTNLLDHFMEEYFFRPSAIVSYSMGGFGGVRAASHLRDMLAELGMPAIPSGFPISKIQDALDENGKPSDEKMNQRIKKFLDELEWYSKALKEARKKGLPY